MNTATLCDRARPVNLCTLQLHFTQEVAPAVERYARHYLLFLPPYRREEILADALGNAWERCLKLARVRRDVAPGAIACYALADAKRGAPPPARGHADVYSACRRGLLHRCHRPSWFQPRADETRRHAPDGLADPKQAPVWLTVSIRLDLPRWLRTLPVRIRLLIAQLARGERVAVLAQRFNYDPTSVRRLRRRLWHLWEVFSTGRRHQVRK